MLEHKAVPVNGVEVIDREEGIVSAIVSVTGIVDRVKDVIEPGAYTKTLRNRTPKGVWHHDMTKPVSKTLSIKELMPGDRELPATLPDGTPWPKEAGALKVLTQFNLKSSRGRDAFADVEFFGADQEWSIGYRVPPGTSEMKGGVRHCKEMDLFEYSPVLFGAMPAARSIVSVKDAQEGWAEVKSELFGTCDDGEGTCCLSCGTKATHDHLEAKSDDLAERWVVDFKGFPPDDMDDVVGTFGTKAQAEAWVQAFYPDGDEFGLELEIRPEAKADEEGDYERFYLSLYEAVMEYADEEEGEKSLGPMVRRPWREHAHKRNPDGRFMSKLGSATREVAREFGKGYAHRDEDSMARRWKAAGESFERMDKVGQRIERKLADRAGRPPSEAAPRLFASIFAAAHLNPVERRFFKAGQEREGAELPAENDLGFAPADFPTDLAATTKQAAWDWANGNDKKYRRIMRVLPRAIDWLWEEPELYAAARMDLRRPRADPSPYAAKSDEFHETLLGGVAALVEFSDALTEEEKSAWTEGLHPRSATGEFAPKDSQRQQARYGGKRTTGQPSRRIPSDTTGWSYRNHWWSDPQGNRRGWAAEEDGDILDGPGGRVLRQGDSSEPRGAGELTPYQRAQAAVYAADEAHKKKGPEAYAKWRRALAALFRGNKPIKPTGKPVDKKDDGFDMEFKRYVSGWDEAKHPRDAHGRFTDSPGEAAMKQALQRMQSGVESAADKLDRLQMDEGDVEIIDMAYFDTALARHPVDPNAPRALRGNPGDHDFSANTPEGAAQIDLAVTSAIESNLNAQRVARFTGMKPNAAVDLAVLSSALEGSSHLTNPDDRLQFATNFMSGKDMAQAYDRVMEDLVRPRRNKRERKNAETVGHALQAAMIGNFGQGWKERVSPIKGPDHSQTVKTERNRRIVSAIGWGVYAGALAGATAIMLAKADDLDLEPFLTSGEEDGIDPEAEAEVEDLEMADAEAEERREIEDKPVNSALLPDDVVGELFAFNTSMVDPDAPPAEEDEDFSTFLYYIAHPEEEVEAEQGGEEPAAEEQPVESEEPPAEGKAWDEVDAVLDFYFNEPPKSLLEVFDFEVEGGFEAKADDAPDEDWDETANDDEFEAFLDDFYGALAEGSDEEIDAKFDSNLHPRDRNGKFTHRGAGVGGKVAQAGRTVNRAASYSQKIVPGRRKIAKGAYSRNQKSAWRRERMAAKLQGRRPSRSTAKFMAAAFSAGRWLPPDERQAHLDEIGVSLNDLRRNIRRDLKSGGSSPMRQKRMERRVASLSDSVFRTEKAWELWCLEIKDAELDAEIADWDEDYVFDLMAKMSPEDLETLIEGIETKGAVSEATGGRVADPGKGNQGNIKPIMRWFERGEGAAKIRWGTKGDFMRCVHLAEKHMNPEHAKGFCNKRHVAVTGSAPGQGPHIGKKADEFELDEFDGCILCARTLDAKDVCTGCGTDYLEFKGARRFMENMVKRAGDGKFATKPGRNLGLTAGAAGMTPKSKPKKSLKRRAGGAVIKGAAKGAVRHPGVVLGAAATGAAGVAGLAAGRKGKDAPGNAPGKPGSPRAAAEAFTGRGPSGSWVDTLDVLADMAGDRDSLLNKLVDDGMAKIQSGEPIINLDLSDQVSGAKLKIAGKYDALQLRRSMVVARAVDRFNRPRLGETSETGQPMPPRIAETVIDMDASTISLTNDRGDKREIPFDRSPEFIAALDASSASSPSSKVDLLQRQYELAKDDDDPAEAARVRKRLAAARGVSEDDILAEDGAPARRLRNQAAQERSAPSPAEKLRDAELARRRAEETAQGVIRDSATHKVGKARSAAEGGSRTVGRANKVRSAAERTVETARNSEVSAAARRARMKRSANRAVREISKSVKSDDDVILTKDEVDLLRIAVRRAAL